MDNNGMDATVPEPTGTGGMIVSPGTGGAIDPGTGGSINVGSGGVIGTGGGGGTGASDGSGGGGPSATGGGGGGDAGAPDLDADADADAEGDAGPATPFVCNQVIGGFVVSQWYPYFETRMETSRWQSLSMSNAYVESWADPNNAVWGQATMTSPCLLRAANPDRVLFIAYSVSLKTGPTYQAALTKAVATIQLKYPGVKRIEILTTLRSPGNKLCAVGDDPLTVVADYVDQAIADVAAASSGLVIPGLKLEVGACDWWEHPNADLLYPAQVNVGQLYAEYYKQHL